MNGWRLIFGRRRLLILASMAVLGVVLVTRDGTYEIILQSDQGNQY